MSSIPKVSVCIPTYNRSQYLRKAIESVLMQSFTDFELIICDNASFDDTSEVVNSFCDDRIAYHRNQENLGAFKNINLCLELARGEYITIFHDDDVMLQDNILDKVSFLNTYQNAGLVDSNAYLIDDLGKVIGMYWNEDIDKKSIAKGEDCFRDLFLGHNTVCFPAVFMRKHCYENLGGFEEIPYCDWELWIRISLFYDIGYISKPLIKYRRHASNDSLNYIGIVEEYKAKASIVSKYRSKFVEVKYLQILMEKDICRRIIDLSLSHLRVSKKTFIKGFFALMILCLKIRFIYSITYALKKIIKKLLGIIKKQSLKIFMFNLPEHYNSWKKNSLKKKWLHFYNQKDCSIHPSIEFTGINNPFDYININEKCTVERDCTFWLSPDQGADLRLSINKSVFIGRNTYIGVFQPVSIGDNTLIGAYSYIISANHSFKNRDIPIRNQGFTGAPIAIEDDVWIGTHVVILPNVTIGKGAIIAAHSLVNKNIPSYEIWGGVPAKFIKKRP
ncbi:glycosyltransferase [Pseudanabaena biceps]|nr:glycosyltransferase [Pseudanabaena biceps]